MTELGRYRILKHLASGGMADVFLATALGIEGFQRHVVIKRIHQQHAKHPGFVQMFLDEARLAASLHHHNIVQVHDIGQDSGEYFYAMEYVHGEDLRALLMRVSKRKQVVPLEHVVTIINAAGAGLHYAHEHRGPDRKPLGLVHRDVSPSNIIVDYDGNVKVVDFGIAKAATKVDQTQSGVLKGKVSYMSPEQCRGKQVDRRSDVYALGIVLYELATARRLFKGDNDFMTMSAIVAGQIPPPSTRRKDLPPQLEAIIMKALAKEPEDRYQTVQAMRLAIDEFATTAGLRTSTTALAAYMEDVFAGRRIEPWLVDGYLEPEDLTEDFGDSQEGLAKVSISAVEDWVYSMSSSVPQSSPLLKAQRKAGEHGDEQTDDFGEEPSAPSAVAGARLPSAEYPAVRAPTNTGVADRPAAEASDRRPSHHSGTPMAWPSAPEQPKRGRGLVIALVALPLIIGGIVAGPRLLASSTESEPSPAAQPDQTSGAPAAAPMQAQPGAPSAASGANSEPGAGKTEPAEGSTERAGKTEPVEATTERDATTERAEANTSAGAPSSGAVDPKTGSADVRVAEPADTAATKPAATDKPAPARPATAAKAKKPAKKPTRPTKPATKPKPAGGTSDWKPDELLPD